MARDHTGRRPIRPCVPISVGEGDPGLFDRQTGDFPPRDLFRVPLKVAFVKSMLRTAGANFLKPACVNRPNQSDFVIWPNSFSQFSVSPQNCGNLASELKNQQDQHKISMALPSRAATNL